MTARGYDELHSEVSVSVFRVSLVTATTIYALTIAEVWGEWTAVGAVCATWVVLCCFNAWVSMYLLKRRGMVVGEAVRAIGNIAQISFLGFAAHDPFALWLWIPFAALAYDQIDSRVSTSMVIASALVVDGFGLHSGEGWIPVIAFDAFALMGLLIGRIRLRTTRAMLLRSDEQRHELALAHGELATTHGRLVEEVAAREQVELELRQAQKLEAIGRLASGIAHEINTPVQFVNDSVHFVDDATRDLLTLAAKSRRTLQTLIDGTPVADVLAAMQAAEDEADLPYVTAQLPGAVARVLDGLERISTIVRSMKEFAHPDLQHLVPADLNRALLATITIAAHEYKLVADVDFDPGELPPVVCRPGEINQVFLNLLVNAAHAIGDVVKDSGKKGRIAIHTRTDGEHVVVSIADTGAGIPETIRGRIFDPFFTTKGVGRGTGQGLAIARNVIKQHGGTLAFESEVGRGTTFTMRLPVTPAAVAASTDAGPQAAGAVRALAS